MAGLVGGARGLGLQGRVVGVTVRPRGVESIRLRPVERGALCEAGGQVRVRDEELAEGDGVRFALIQKLLAGLLVDGFVGDIDATKDLLEVWSEAVGPAVLARRD